MIFIVLLAHNYNVLIGEEFPTEEHLDLVIFLDVQNLRVKVTVQRILRALCQGASFRRGNTSQCC